VVAKSADEARRSALGTWKTTGLPASGGVISNQSAANGNQGFKGGDGGLFVTTDPYAVEALNMTPKERLAISKLLVGARYLKKPTSKYNKTFADALIAASQDFAVEATRTGRPDLTIRSFLTENYQEPTGTGSGASNLPSRSIYQYTEADRIKMLDDVSQTLRGQGITEEDKSAKWYKDLKKSIDNMISTGTVSTSKKVKNPKTGQLEVQTVSTPGFSQEQVAATAEKAIRKATPEDVARKERVDFTSWMFSALGGK
jgi:hypothetical protein